MEINRSLNHRDDKHESAVLTVGSLLSFATLSGIVSYDMASDDEAAEKKFLDLLRQEEIRLNKENNPFPQDRGLKAKAAVINKAVTKTKADNLLRQVGHAVDGHVIENGKFRPARAPAFVREVHKERKRAAPIALLFFAGLLALAYPRPANADDREPPANITKCDSIEELEEAYPNSHFTTVVRRDDGPYQQVRRPGQFNGCFLCGSFPERPAYRSRPWLHN
jgi:hypothetical protein